MLTRPATAHEAIGRLGELRRRQGRIDEAEALFDQTDPNPMGLLGRARLAIERADLPAPRTSWHDSYAGFQRGSRRAMRGPGDADRGQPAEQRPRSGNEGTRRDRSCGSDHGDASPPCSGRPLSRSPFSSHRGEWEAARTALEDAVILYQRAGAPFEVAQARVDLGCALDRLGRGPAARRELRLAHDAFRELGAEASRPLALWKCSAVSTPKYRHPRLRAKRVSAAAKPKSCGSSRRAKQPGDRRRPRAQRPHRRAAHLHHLREAGPARPLRASLRCRLRGPGLRTNT